MKPRRRMPPTTSRAPIRIASSPARATARCGSPAAKGSTLAPMIGASDESGPRTMIRDGPTSAYTSKGMIVA